MTLAEQGRIDLARCCILEAFGVQLIQEHLVLSRAQGPSVPLRLGRLVATALVRIASVPRHIQHPGRPEPWAH